MVLRDAVGHLLVAADQRGAGPAPHQPDPGPQVGGHQQVRGVAAVQVEHPALALGLAAPQALLHAAYRLGVDALEQPPGHRPGLLRGVAGDDVQADAVLQGALALGGQRGDPRKLGGHRGGRLSPGEVDVGVTGSHRARGA